MKLLPGIARTQAKVRKQAKTLSLLLLINCFGLIALSPSALAANPVAAASGPAEEAAAPAPVQDSLGRSTPRGAFEGYIKAVSREDYQRAAQFLDLVPLPFDKRSNGEQVARILQQALDQNSTLPPVVMLSNDPAGQSDDGLPPEAEKIGTLEIGDSQVPLLLERLESGEGPIWVISSDTLAKLPSHAKAESSLPINKFIPDTLMEHKWNGVPWGHWVAMLLLALASYGTSRLAVGVLSGTLRTVLARRFQELPQQLIKAFAAPLQWFLAVVVFSNVVQRAGISVIIRQFMSEAVVIVAWISLVWLVWRLVDVITTVSERRMTSQARFGALSAVRLLRRCSLFLLVAIGIIVTLATAGVDVTTGLAALGIGGIAVALGAQKMVENLVGSMTLVFDQPVRVGDFCRVGETLGTVEQIGMRSTRIRTLDRTLVTIPNADFSVQKIENFAHRDRFLFKHMIAVRYQTSPEQMRLLLSELRELLQNHPQVDPDPARARFTAFGTSALNIELFAYILAGDYNEFLAVQEEIILSVTELVRHAGTGFALPSQTVYMAHDASLARPAAKHAAQHTESPLQSSGYPWTPRGIASDHEEAEPLHSMSLEKAN